MDVLAHIKTAAVVEVPHAHHPVVVQPVQVKREKYPFTGFIDFQGLKVDVENRKGDYRRGADKDGHEWKVLMHNHYGEIRDTEGVDGDNLDVYVGPNHDSSLVVVVRQHRPDTGAYDEDKVMIGFDSVEEAIGAYKKQYDKPGFYKDGDYLAMPIGKFWRWVHDTRKHGKKVASMKNVDQQLATGAHRAVDRAKHAAVPDILRPTLSPFAREFAVHPGLKKGLLGAGGAAAAAVGASKARAYDKAEGAKEEESGLPSVERAGLRGAGVGAGIGAGAGAVGGHLLQRGVNKLEGQVASAASHLNEFASKLRAEGRTGPEILDILNRAGRAGHVKDVHTAIQGLQRFRKATPAVLGVAGGLYGALAGGANRAMAAKVQKDNVQEMADVLSDVEYPRKPGEKAKAPSFGVAMDPRLTTEQKERAYARYGTQKADEKPMGVSAPLIGAGLGAAYGLAAGYPGHVAHQHRDAFLRGMGMTSKSKSPLRIAGLAGAGVGLGLGALTRHANNAEIENWRAAREKGTTNRLARQQLADAQDWFTGYEPEGKDLEQLDQTRERARKYNAYRAKTAEHVALPDPGAVLANLRPVLAQLLALYQLYYFAHWTSSGEQFYADHQLFERLYKSTQEEFDQVAERITGVVGDLGRSDVFSEAVSHLSHWAANENKIEGAIVAEHDFLASLLDAYRALDTSAGLTLGVDDLLMTLASQHEANLYLLRQRTTPQIGTATNVR